MIEAHLPAPQARAAALGIPYRVHAVLTHRCNLNCAHCYQAEHQSQDLSLAELEQVFSQLAELGTLFCTLGGGEPMVRRDFWEVLQISRQLGFAVDVYTNGLMVDAAVARRFRELGVLRVSLSLHGSHAGSHDLLVRRKGAFERVNRAISELEEAGVQVQVKSNLTALNASESEKLREMFKGRPLVRLGLSHRIFAKDDGSTSPRHWRMSSQQEQAVYRRRFQQLGPAQIERIIADAEFKLRQPDTAFVPCQAARTTLALHPNGDLSPCTQSAGMVMGNVRQRSIREIWEHSTVGESFRSLNLTHFEDCRSCPLRKLCSRCVVLSHEESGKLTGHSEQVCRSTKLYWLEMNRRAQELGIPFPIPLDSLKIEPEEPATSLSAPSDSL